MNQEAADRCAYRRKEEAKRALEILERWESLGKKPSKDFCTTVVQKTRIGAADWNPQTEVQFRSQSQRDVLQNRLPPLPPTFLPPTRLFHLPTAPCDPTNPHSSDDETLDGRQSQPNATAAKPV